MPVVRRGNADRVDVFVIVHLTEVLHHLYLPSILCLELTRPFSQDVLVYIAECSDLYIRQFRKAGNVIGAASVYADNGHPNSIIRPEGTGWNDGRHTECH